jgi:PKD repeat protein
MSDKLNMEQLMRTRLDGAELSPSPASWKAIQRKLRWKQFLRFNPGRVNIYYAGMLLLAATGLVLLLAGERDQAETVLEDIALQPSQAGNTVEESGGESIQEANLENRHGEIQSDSPASLAQTDPDLGQGAPNQDSIIGSEALLDKSELAAIIPDESAKDHKVLPLPVAYFTSSIRSGCAPLTVQFSNQSINASSYYWDFGTGETSQEQNPMYEFKEAGHYMVTLSTQNHGSQTTVSRMMVEVLASPVADFQIEEGLVGIDNHVVLNLVNYSSDASSFAWNLVNEECIDCSDWSSIEHLPTLELKTITPESRSVRLEVINEQGCSDTVVQDLPLIVQSSETRIKFATAFSPNPSGPGESSFNPGSKRIDLFHPVYIEVPADFHMRVYTRRGELVFETHEIYHGWDGYIHQEAAPGNVYVWMVEGKWKDGESFSLHGDVTLVWNQYW